jgi:hypothetical protein
VRNAKWASSCASSATLESTSSYLGYNASSPTSRALRIGGGQGGRLRLPAMARQIATEWRCLDDTLPLPWTARMFAGGPGCLRAGLHSHAKRPAREQVYSAPDEAALRLHRLVSLWPMAAPRTTTKKHQNVCAK